MASLFDTCDDNELTDAEEFDLVEQFIRDAMDALPDRIEIHGRLFMRSGSPPIYTNIRAVWAIRRPAGADRGRFRSYC